MRGFPLSKFELISGSGGGGKSGGGSGRVAQEAPDSLRSKQYAKVVDLISEGEIFGLVNGLKSVYLDDTPVQNANGSFNFDGVSFDIRNGTQSQTHIAGFNSIESETPISVEITKDDSVVRTITSGDVDALRLTVSVPRLSKQDTTNGDVNGTSVQIAVDVQSDGGGFVPQIIGVITKELTLANGVASSLGADIKAAQVEVVWTGDVKTTPSYSWYSQPAGAEQYVEWRLDYRLVGASSWTALRAGNFRGTGKYVKRYTGLTSTQVFERPTETETALFNPAQPDRYEFRVVKISGDGILSVRGNGQFLTAIDTITGKTSSRYQRAYRIPLQGNPPYDIRVRRLTADSTSQALQNQTFFDSYTEIVDEKLTYPNSALIALSVDSERFDRIPVRGYDIKGLLVQVPTNYNPNTRVYTGVWNGSFKIAWTDNPAWCFYDMLTNERYGCGEFITPGIVDKWSLYEIAQYCDELVPNGLGGQEPRFTLNVYLQTREEAYKLIRELASAFRGIVYMSYGALIPVQDSPKQPVAQFTPANVIDGQFNYAGSSRKTRSTVVLVTWNDPEDRYRQTVEYVEDRDAIARFGIIQKEVNAIGCTSRGQANRYGRAILYSEKMETETITFTTGLDGLPLAPGDIIQTTDPVRSGVRMGGRVVSSTLSAVTLDAPVTLEADIQHTLFCTLPDGTVESRAVINLPGSHDEITVSPDFSDAPLSQSIWVLSATNILPETWRVITIEESDQVNASITALEYRDDKYLAIENNLILENRETSTIGAGVQDPVTNIVIEEELYSINAATVAASISVSWQGNAKYYDVEYRASEGNYQRLTTSATSIDIRPIPAGIYDVRITAINPLGIRSQPSFSQKEIYGLTAPPADVVDFAIQAINGNAHLSFSPSTDLDVVVGGHLRVRHSTIQSGATWSAANDIGQKISGGASNAVLPLLSGSYLAKWVDSSGNESKNARIITTNAPSILSLNVVQNIIESPDFLGDKQSVGNYPFGGQPALILDSVNTIDQMTDNIDLWPKFSEWGGITQVGIYYFAESIDLGEVVTSIIKTQVQASSYLTSYTIDSWPNLDSLESIDGEQPSSSRAELQIRTTDDDPLVSPEWSEWQNFNVGDWTARAFEFRLLLSVQIENSNIAVTGLSVEIDMPDKIRSGDDIVSGAGVFSVEYDAPFFVNPAVGISAQGMATGDYYQLTNKTRFGFDIIFKNTSGTTISRTFDYIARAY